MKRIKVKINKSEREYDVYALLTSFFPGTEVVTSENDNEAKKRHVMSGHLELHTACEFIRVTDRDKTLKNVIVGHLSGENANPKMFRQEIEKVTEANIQFSKKGLVIEL